MRRVFLPLLLLAAAPPEARPDQVAAYRCAAGRPAGTANLAEAQRAYGWRSVTILRAGVRGDLEALARMVAPSARFTIFNGDVGFRPSATGAEAAVAFARHLGGRTFDFSTGSWAPSIADPCGSITSELTIKGDDPSVVKTVRFEYDHGILTAATGSETGLVSGRLLP